MRIALCDDNQQELAHYKAVLTKFSEKHKIPIAIDTYESGDALLFEMEDAIHRPDIVYLDIRMPQKNGILVANELRQQNYPIELIFLTASEENMLDAFDVKAFHYIIKSKTSEEKFEQIFLDAYQRISDKTLEMINFECAGEIRAVALRDIKYFEVNRKIITVYYRDQSFDFVSTLNRLELTLAEKGFTRISKHCMVSNYYVQKVSYTSVTMEGGAILSVGRSFAPNVRAALSAKK